MNVVAHDIHSDASAGNLRHLLGGREARQQDERIEFGVGHFFERPRAREPAFAGLLLDARYVETSTVVLDLERDLTGVIGGGDADQACIELAGGDALGDGFDAMIGGVADDVRQRRAHEFDHLAVQLGLRAKGLDPDLFSQFQRKIAHQARQGGKQLIERLHPHAHDRVLQIAGGARQILHGALDALVAPIRGELQQLVAGQHEFRDDSHQPVEHADRYAHGFGRPSGRAGGVARRGGIGRGRDAGFGFRRGGRPGGRQRRRFRGLQ